MRFALVALAVATILGKGVAAVPQPFQPVTEARVDPAGGAPRLLINGRPVAPFIFFFNTDVQRDTYLAPQVRLAAGAGVHIYSLPFRCPRLSDGVTPNWAHSDALLDRFIAADPQALFILRLFPGPNWSWREWKEAPDSEKTHFADGTTGDISVASDLFWGPTDEDLARLIRHYEASPYGGRIVGYHPGGPNSEMFQEGYREKGPDYGPANTRRFRAWLRGQYGSDARLRAAWGNPTVTLDSAAIPAVEAGRFPMHGVGAGETLQMFSTDRAWVDFSAYSNDIMADRLIDWAKLVKRVTGGRKLSVFFYGYTFELPGSFSGHERLGRVLDCPEVDALVSPYSYRDRPAGGAGNFMSPVDSVTAHGKLWLNEDDTRTSVIDTSLKTEAWGWWEPTRSLAETRAVLDRNLAAVMVHRAGTWWMDLLAAGAFNEPSLWARLQARLPLWEASGPYRPQVALIVDEGSKLWVHDDWQAHSENLQRLRDEVAKAGVAVGYYTLADFIAGVAPPCRAYVFANAFRLDAEQVQAIRARLDREGAAAVWLYAPGYLGATGPDPAQVRRLTGFGVTVHDGRHGSDGAGVLTGERWGQEVPISPRLAIEPAGAEPLGHYRADHLLSAAARRDGRRLSFLFTDLSLTWPVLGRLLDRVGVHRWCRNGEVVLTDGRLLVVHAAEAGEHPVYLPAGAEVEPIEADIARRTGRAVYVRFDGPGTAWLTLR